jgi:hypothetical protein
LAGAEGEILFFRHSLRQQSQEVKRPEFGEPNSQTRGSPNGLPKLRDQKQQASRTVGRVVVEPNKPIGYQEVGVLLSLAMANPNRPTSISQTEGKASLQLLHL